MSGTFIDAVDAMSDSDSEFWDAMDYDDDEEFLQDGLGLPFKGARKAIKKGIKKAPGALLRKARPKAALRDKIRNIELKIEEKNTEKEKLVSQFKTQEAQVKGDIKKLELEKKQAQKELDRLSKKAERK